MWIRKLFRALGRGLAGAAAVSPWPVVATPWACCPYCRRCEDCRCMPAPGHPERLVSCPPDEVERALWAQFEFEGPRPR